MADYHRPKVAAALLEISEWKLKQRMRNVARARQRRASRAYADHVMRFCRAECAQGGVCRTARALDLEASAADWAVARLKRA